MVSAARSLTSCGPSARCRHAASDRAGRAAGTAAAVAACHRCRHRMGSNVGSHSVCWAGRERSCRFAHPLHTVNHPAGGVCRAAATGDPSSSSTSGDPSSSSRDNSTAGRTLEETRGAVGGPVDIAIEPGPSNSRCIWAGVDVAAPAPAVYAALTSYEALGTFIPGLAENRCLERYHDGCKLLQVGRRELALGLKFCARVCLRIREHPTGMPPSLLARSPNSSLNGDSSSSSSKNNDRTGSGSGSSSSSAGRSWWPFGGSSERSAATTSSSNSSDNSGSSTSRPNGNSASGGGSSVERDSSSASMNSSGSSDGGGRQPFSEAKFLRPRSPLGGGGGCMDVSFELLEGDFAAFKGLWRVQGSGPATCRLSYTLFVRPQPWLLVGLIEQRVQAEISANLAAVKAHVEAQMEAGAGPPPPTLPLPPSTLR